MGNILWPFDVIIALFFSFKPPAKIDDRPRTSLPNHVPILTFAAIIQLRSRNVIVLDALLLVLK